jgi:Gpi18-like mannosyltransferase
MNIAPSKFPDSIENEPEKIRKRFSWFFTDALLPFLSTRAGLVLVGFLALALLPRSMDAGKWQFSSNPLINMWSRWDAGWYLSIAEKGYSYHPGAPCNVNFAPLYPMLIGGVCRLFHGHSHTDMLLTGIILSNIALILAVTFLYLLMRLDFDERTSSRSALFLLVFPSSLFLSAVYPESLFLAMSLTAFYCVRKGRWGLAGLFGGLAALTRPYGIILVFPFLYEYMDQRNFHFRSIRPDILWLGLTGVIFSIWPFYLYRSFGNPFVFVTSQSSWNRTPAPPWIVIEKFFNSPVVVHGPDHSIVDFTFTAIAILLIIYSWGFIRGSYVLYSALMLTVMVSSGLLVSMMRYDLDIFPLFFSLALLGRHPLFRQSIVPLFACLSGFFMAAFALWRWVA